MHSLRGTASLAAKSSGQLEVLLLASGGTTRNGPGTPLLDSGGPAF